MFIFCVNMSITLYNLYNDSLIESDVQYLLIILMSLEAKRHYVFIFSSCTFTKSLLHSR